MRRPPNRDWCSSNDRSTYNGEDYGRRSEVPTYLHPILTAARPSLSGTIRYAYATYPLTGGPIPGSAYDVGATPSLSEVIGNWTLIDLRGAPSSYSIDADGKVTGADRGCPLTGYLIANPEDKINLLRLRAVVGPCDGRLTDFEGFAVSMLLNAGGAQLLIWAGAEGGVGFDYVIAIGRR